VCTITSDIIVCLFNKVLVQKENLGQNHELNSKEYLNEEGNTGYWWLTPVILATQETAIRRLKVQS
jgi:hypothetical protein